MLSDRDRPVAGLGAIHGRSGLFLVLSGLATGASWLCYFRALKIGQAARGGADRQAERRAGGAVRLRCFSAKGSRRSHWLGIALIGGGAVLIAGDLSGR